MSVAVLCNLSDGVIIGVDSALTVTSANGVERVFEDGGKLFQIGKKLGVATFGWAGLGGRSIGSFLHEFEGTHLGFEEWPIPETVESLRDFFVTKYKEAVAEGISIHHVSTASNCERAEQYFRSSSSTGIAKDYFGEGGEREEGRRDFDGYKSVLCWWHTPRMVCR